MLSIHVALFLAAIILFVLAALPLNLKVRCEWLAFACIAATQIV